MSIHDNPTLVLNNQDQVSFYSVTFQSEPFGLTEVFVSAVHPGQLHKYINSRLGKFVKLFNVRNLGFYPPVNHSIKELGSWCGT